MSVKVLVDFDPSRDINTVVTPETAMNFVKKLVSQGIKPDYIYNETGGRFVKTAHSLGMGGKDFFACRCSNPNKVILEPNAVTIFDWVRPKDFSKTADLFDSLVSKVEETKGLLICFVQLKTNNEFFIIDAMCI